MSGYQFIHVETYAKVSTKKGKPSIQSVVNETMRVEGYCPHVYQSKRPELLLGLDPRKLPQIALERTSIARDRQGRKIRKDAPLMLAGVISLESDSNVNFREFLKRSIAFLRKKYDQNLMSVVLHLDEAHPHLHFYAIPSVIDGTFNMSELHNGMKARNECKGGYSKKAHAYKQAMREYQDSYYDDVGSKLGLTRLGPRVQRLTRKVWKAQQKQAQAFSLQRRELNKRQQRLTKDQALLVDERKSIKQQETELTTICKASIFNKKHEKNKYLRKKLSKLQKQSSDNAIELGEKQEGITKLYKELKNIKQGNDLYHKKLEAMSYKLELKDQFIRQLKLKRDNKHEKKHTRSEQYSCQL